jgi:hypothetical protein
MGKYVTEISQNMGFPWFWNMDFKKKHKVKFDTVGMYLRLRKVGSSRSLE